MLNKIYNKNCVTSKDSDHSAHPPSMARVYPFLDSYKAVQITSDQQRLWSDCADAQADLSLRWSHKFFLCKFCRAQKIVFDNWAISWQNKQNGMCAQRRQRSTFFQPLAVYSLRCSHEKKVLSLATHWAHSEDSDQTGWMPRLIWVFAGRTCHFVGFVMRWLIS